MDISRLEQLESHILKFIERLSQFKNENVLLKDKINLLEKENTTLINEREILKLKIEGMLTNLEKIEIEKYEEYHTG
jgi:hypothetical protein